jgi:hypothetical protein
MFFAALGFPKPLFDRVVVAAVPAHIPFIEPKSLHARFAFRGNEI